MGAFFNFSMAAFLVVASPHSYWGFQDAEGGGGGWFDDGPGRPGRLSTLSVFLCKSVLYGAFVWVRRALKYQKRRFPARADKTWHSLYDAALGEPLGNASEKDAKLAQKLGQL
jgi:hypothetical protein